MKLLEKTRKKLDVGLDNESFDMKSKTQAAKAKISKWDYIKLRSSCTAKEKINKRKRQPIDWKKIFANHVSVKGLISKIFKEFKQQQQNKQSDTILVSYSVIKL